jgi:hypothetical protein
VDNLYLTPRLGSNTREARTRASWYVAQHMHDALLPRPIGVRFDDSGAVAVAAVPGMTADEASWAPAQSSTT